MADPKVYPVTASLEQQVKQVLQEALVDESRTIKWPKTPYEMGKAMAEVLVEYEHGTADVEDLFPTEMPKDEEERRQWMLQSVLNIYYDLFLTLMMNNEEVK